MQRFENSSSEGMIPTKKEARQALVIAMRGLRIHTKCLNETEYSLLQKFGRYLDISSVS